MSLASLIRTSRKAQDLTQVELAQLLGVSKGAVAQWELEEGGTTPSVKNMARLREVLKIDVAAETIAGFSHGYQFVEDPEKLAWLRLFDDMDESERMILGRMLRSAHTPKSAA